MNDETRQLVKQKYDALDAAGLEDFLKLLCYMIRLDQKVDKILMLLEDTVAVGHLAEVV